MVLFWTNLNPFHPKMLCGRFGWNWLSGSLNLVNVFSLFRNYLPLEKRRALHLNTWIPFTQGCFDPSLGEIRPVVLKKKILKIRQKNFAISYLSPLGKGRGPSFEQIWIPFNQGCFVPSLLEIDPVVLKKKMKNVKSLPTDGWTRYNRRSEKLTWAFTSDELKKVMTNTSYNSA